MKNYILISILILLTTNCNKSNESIPSYITINSIVLDENNTSENITDAWVYINDNIVGTYELPANLPVLKRGKQKITIRAGIKSNGISATRIAYPFYTLFIDTINLLEDSSITINPIVKYKEEIDWNTVFIEDFTFGTSGIKFVPELPNTSTFHDTITDNRTCGYITLKDSLFRTKTLVLEGKPQESESIFLEMDYKCDSSSFIIGVYANGAPFQIMSIFPKQNWNKIYIDLTSIISAGNNTAYFEIFLSITKPEEINSTTLYIDNFKIIYI